MGYVRVYIYIVNSSTSWIAELCSSIVLSKLHKYEMGRGDSITISGLDGLLNNISVFKVT